MKKVFNLKIIALASMALMAFTGVVIGSFAWFSTNSVSDIDISGTSFGAYFAEGDGTSDHPYVIKSARHFYNLAWLQDMGEFNKQLKNEQGVPQTDESGNPIIEQIYFKLDESLRDNGLDLKGQVLPPIGTEQYPFLGNFNGNNVAIKNFTISNNFSDYNKNHPMTISEFDDEDEDDVNLPQIVGLFGVVGKKGGNYSYSSLANEVKNFVINNFTIKTVANNTLVGMAAGYVNGTVSGVGVNNATFDIASNCRVLDSANLTDKITKYGLIGYSTSKYEINGEQGEVNVYTPVEVPGSGFTPNYGGSADIKKLFDYGVQARKSLGRSGNDKRMLCKRLTDSQGNVIATYGFGETDISPIYLSGVNTVQKGTYPRVEVYDTAIPFAFEGNDSTGYSVSSNNTGYITASDISEDRTKNLFYSALRIGGNSAPFNNSQIGLSIGQDANNTATNLSSKTIEGDSFPLYIVTKSSESAANASLSEFDGYTMIDYDGDSQFTDGQINSNVSSATSYSKGTSSGDFVKYAHRSMFYKRMTPADLGYNSASFTNSYTSLKSLFKSGGTYTYGLHFMSESTYPTQLNMNKKLTIDYAKFAGGTTYTNGYELLSNSVDFNLKRTGSISFYGYHPKGASDRSGGRDLRQYGVSATAYNFFNIYKIYRETNNSGKSVITDFKRITLIYRDKRLPDKDPNQYVYVYEGGSDTYSSDSNNYELAFDTSWIKGSSNRFSALPYTIYYFEIPLSTGEYAFGSVQPDGNLYSNGGYIMYLDIAANGSVAGDYYQDKYSVQSKEVGYPVGIDFVIVNNVDYSSIIGGLSATIYIPNLAYGQATFIYSANPEYDQSDGDPPPKLLSESPPQGKTFTGTVYSSYKYDDIAFSGITYNSVASSKTVYEQITNVNDGVVTRIGTLNVVTYNAEGQRTSQTTENFTGNTEGMVVFTGVIPATVEYQRMYLSETSVVLLFTTSKNVSEVFNITVTSIKSGCTVKIGSEDTSAITTGTIRVTAVTVS